MLDGIKNAHTNIQNKIKTFPCAPLDSKCTARKAREKKQLINEKHKKIIDVHNKLVKPSSYNKIMHKHYDTGVMNRLTGSKCNNNLNGASFISKSHYATKNTDSILQSGFSKKANTVGHHIDCSSCTENFDNFDNHKSPGCNKKIINILLLVLLITCLVPYLYFFIKQFTSKRKKKY
jgi:hypothetical protein